jgi:hypothetical protein
VESNWWRENNVFLVTVVANFISSFLPKNGPVKFERRFIRERAVYLLDKEPTAGTNKDNILFNHFFGPAESKRK